MDYTFLPTTRTSSTFEMKNRLRKEKSHAQVTELRMVGSGPRLPCSQGSFRCFILLPWEAGSKTSLFHSYLQPCNFLAPCLSQILILHLGARGLSFWLPWLLQQPQTHPYSWAAPCCLPPGTTQPGRKAYDPRLMEASWGHPGCAPVSHRAAHTPFWYNGALIWLR